MRRVPDCALAGDLVGFRATRTLDDILRAVIDEQISRGADAVTPPVRWPRRRRPPAPDGGRGAVRIDVPDRVTRGGTPAAAGLSAAGFRELHRSLASGAGPAASPTGRP